MYEEKVNVYINSKNRATNETVSNFNVSSLMVYYDYTTKTSIGPSM